MAIRKICVVITARPSYSRVKTLLIAIQKNERLELQLVVAASALLSRYGTAIDFIERDGFKVNAKVYNVLEGGSLSAQAKTTGLGIIELSSVFESLKPDAVLTIADRYETMSTAIAASYLNIPLIHLQGGEISGNIDEKVRHAITKLSDIHFACTTKARENIIRMGENEECVFNTGCPSIDIAKKVKNSSGLDFDPYKKYGGVGPHPDFTTGYIVVMQHPVTTEYKSSREQVLITLQAVEALDIPAFWFWPNIDAGSDGTSNALRSYRENNACRKLHFFKNMEPEDFLKLLLGSNCLIGNSSAGIRECAYLGIPVVNLGTRQSGRERGSNVVDVGYEKEALKGAIQSQIENKYLKGDILYGEGNAGEKIAHILSEIPFTYKKRLNY